MSGQTFVTARRLVGGRHHGEGDKYIFRTAPDATISHPVDPTNVTATWK
jgi:hypothetical protein